MSSFPTKLVVVLGIGLLLTLLNTDPVVHNFVIDFDTQFTIKLHSLIANNSTFGQTIFWINTRIGDIFVLSCLCLLFLIHGLLGSNLNETINRFSFWLWLGILTGFIYALECVSESFLKRHIPLITLPQYSNLIATYGSTLHTCATSSFPSGHGTAYLFFAMMAWPKYPRMCLILWCIGFIMLSLRLICGLHWLSDIVIGSLYVAILLMTLIEDTPLKNSYHYVNRLVSYLVHKIVSWQLFKKIFRRHK